MVRGVIFDLDGVIVSTDELHYEAWKRLADELGITGFTREDNARQRGVSRMASLEVVLAKDTSGRAYTDEEKTALADRKNAFYVESISRLTPRDILPGVRKTLAKLRSRGVALAIGSVSRNTRQILSAIGLAEAFAAVVDGYSVTRSKPEPDVFLEAAVELEILPGMCAVVEDADAGIEAAVRGGFLPIGVSAAAANPAAVFSARDLADPALNWDAILNAEWHGVWHDYEDKMVQYLNDRGIDAPRSHAVGLEEYLRMMEALGEFWKMTRGEPNKRGQT